MNPFHNDQRGSKTHFPFFGPTSSIRDESSQLQRFHDPSLYTGFNQFLNRSTDYNTAAGAFALSSSSPEQFFAPKVEQKPLVDTGDLAGTGEIPLRLKSSSVLCPSTKVDEYEQDPSEGKKDRNQTKEVSEDGVESLKKVNKQNKKKQREPRFTFMTKSEVDHLDDGYRWRKYGQKAVKNSSYPRSYYRCTTQNCAVKKRVERSYKNPSTVVTTYEGQHNHHLPETLQRNLAAGILYPPSMMAAQGLMIAAAGVTGISQAPLAQMPRGFYSYGGGGGDGVGGVSGGAGGGGSIYQQSTLTPLQQLQIPDYGLLQDTVPSMTFIQEP